MNTEIGALDYLAERPALIAYVNENDYEESEYVDFARDHFLEHGAGDEGTINFDPVTYVERSSVNGDLVRELGTDPFEHTEHFIDFGYGEIEDGDRPDYA